MHKGPHLGNSIIIVSNHDANPQFAYEDIAALNMQGMQWLDLA